jgi:hypothetical protein
MRLAAGAGSTVLLAMSCLEPSAQAAVERCSIEVRFNEPQEGRHYVAVVPEEKPWAEPLRETVAPATAPAVSWEVPPGRYRVVCAAHMRHAAFQAAFAIKSSERRSFACRTDPLVAVTGELRSAADDTPIGGARIGHASAFLVDSPRKLSAMGEEFTLADRSTVTDARGRFRLLGGARYSSTVWIEAKGFSPGYSPDIRFPPHGGDLGVMRLEKGAALRAQLQGGARDGAMSRVSLRRRDLIGEGERETLSRRIWRRPVEASTLDWPSLPPGEYEVLFEQMDPAVPPTQLAAVRLGAGEEREIVLPIPPAPTSGSSEVGAELRLLLPEEVSGVETGIELRRFDGVAIRPAAASPRAVAGGTLWKVPAGCRAGWAYWLGSASQVSAPVQASTAGCSEALRVELFAASEVHGQLVAPAGAPLPAVGRVAAVRCARRARDVGTAAGSYPFVVGKNGRWLAEVPAGCLDLAIAAGDFATVAYRGVHAGPGAKADLGAQNLFYGGSLRVRITTDEGGAVEGAAVDLFAARDREQVVAASFGHRDLAAVRQGKSGAGGWVQLGGLPGGEFVVRVRAGGAPPFVSDPVRVAPPEETVMPDLHLPAPAVLRVGIRPSEALGSLYASYMVNLKGLGPPGSIAGASVLSPAGSDGTAEFSRLAPGRWHLAVMGRSGSGMATLREEDTQVRPGLNSLTLDLDTKVFHGRVTYKQLPLAATLDLRPLPPDGRSVTRATSSADGAFAVALERGGRYAVEVHEIGGAAGGAVPAVTFTDVADLVEVRVPDGSLSGAVVDGQEKPVAKAQVTAEQVTETRTDGAQSGDLSSTARGTVSGVDGRFRVEGLTAGSWMVVATLDGRRSDPVAASLQDGIPEDGLKLVIQDREKLTGHVLAASGEPVAGAVVAIDFPPSETAIWPRRIVTVSAADGSFEVERLSPPDSMVNLAAQAAGFPTTTSRRPLTGGALEIQLTPLGGRVDLHLNQGGWGEVPGDLVVLVAADGSFVGSRTAGAVQRAGWLSLPSLAPGQWTLVRLDSIASEIAAVAGAGRSLVALANFMVAPGGAIQVEVSTLRP